MLKMTFTLHLSTEKYLQFYQGTAKYVIVQADDGRTLKFPAGNLQQFVAKDGINGRFEITFSSANKIIDFRRL